MNTQVHKSFIGSLMVSLDRFLEEKLQGQRYEYLWILFHLAALLSEQSCQCILASTLTVCMFHSTVLAMVTNILHIARFSGRFSRTHLTALSAAFDTVGHSLSWYTFFSWFQSFEDITLSGSSFSFSHFISGSSLYLWPLNSVLEPSSQTPFYLYLLSLWSPDSCLNAVQTLKSPNFLSAGQPTLSTVYSSAPLDVY